MLFCMWVKLDLSFTNLIFYIPCIVIVIKYMYQQMYIQYVKYFAYKLCYVFRRVFAIFREKITERNLYVQKVGKFKCSNLRAVYKSKYLQVQT